MKAKDLINIRPIMQRIISTPTERKTAIDISKFLDEYNVELEKVAAAREKVLEQYCMRDKQNKLKIKGGVYQVPDKMKDKCDDAIEQAVSYDVTLPELPAGVLLTPGEATKFRELGII